MPLNPSGYPVAQEIDGNLRIRDIYGNGQNGNLTIDGAFSPGSMLGLKTITGGGAIPFSMINGAMALGLNGLFLDPSPSLPPWDMSGLVIPDGNKNFKIKSLMNGSIGFNGTVQLPAGYPNGGYIKANPTSALDGIQIFTLNPTSAPTTGFIFEDCVIVGTCPGGGVVHLGGGERECGFVNTLVYNLSSATGSYGVISDTALSNNNGENLVFSFTGGGGIAGNYASLGWGIGDQTQHSNDTFFYDLRTSGGTYSMVFTHGGGLTFTNYYDRSNPSTAVIHNSGSRRMTFIGGELQNNNGQIMILDASGASVTLENMAVTNAAANGATMISLSNGASLTFRGECDFNNPMTISVTTASTTLDMSDPDIVGASATISGTTGTLLLAQQYSGSAPVTTSWSGNILNPYQPNSWTALTPLNSYVNSGSGPNLEFRQNGDTVEIVGDVTTPATPNVVLATLPAGVNVPKSQMLQVIDRTSGAESATTARIQGSPASITIAGATAAHELAISGRVYSTA